ncbi:hypothetical protein [Methylobrevis albus]|uniref:SPOR domain-containing protein n=1 Tax=Methylobrevis albus TaxID=2793297 RepID=A0A931I138_9HYPH|nr:hypothetical protein [Methylobrevis albus]MBH0237013.1 hypothetical protein [Methylobrevis albus]
MSRGADQRRGEGYDPLGDEQGEAPGLVVMAWGVAAALAFGIAVVALQYGGPDRNTVDLPPPNAVAADQSIAAMPRADREASTATADEIAALREEVRRLRQSVELLRSQGDNMTLRLGAIEQRGFEEITGSIGRGEPFADPPPEAARPAPAPPVAVAEPPAPGVDFGLELGTFADLTGLRSHWREVRAARPDLFGQFRAVAAMRDRGGRTELLLVAGPIASAAAAAENCLEIENEGIPCAPAFFVGQPLATP